MDDNLNTFSSRQFQTMNFEEVDVTETIFSACDTDFSEHVKVSILIAYMTKEAGSDPQSQEMIMKMENLLDPEKQNVLVDRQTFRDCLNTLVEDQKRKSDGIPVRESPDGQSPIGSPNSTTTNDFDILAPLSPYCVRNLDESYSCGDTSILSNSILVDELNEKLKEKNQEIITLENENAKLRSKLKSSENECANLQYDYDVLAQKYVRLSEQVQLVQTLKAERSEMRESLISMEGQSQSYFEQLQTIQRELRKSKRYCTEIEAQNKDLISDLEQLSTKNENLTQKLESLQTEVKRLRNENESKEIDNMKKEDTIRELDLTVQNLTADKKHLQEVNNSLTSQIKAHEESFYVSMMGHNSSKILSTSIDSGDSDILHPHVVSVLREHSRLDKSHPSLLAEITVLQENGNGSNHSNNKENISHSDSDRSFNSSLGSPSSGKKVARYNLNNSYQFDRTFTKGHKDRALISRGRYGPYTSTPAAATPSRMPLTSKKLRFPGLSPRKSIGACTLNKSCQTDFVTTCDSNVQTCLRECCVKDTQTCVGEYSDVDTQTVIVKSLNADTQTVILTSEVAIQSKMTMYPKKNDTSSKPTSKKAADKSVIPKDKSSLHWTTPVVSNIPRYSFTSPRGTRYATFTTCSIKRKRSIQSQTNMWTDNSEKNMCMATTQTENRVCLLPGRKRTRNLSFPQESSTSSFVEYATRFTWFFELQKEGLSSPAGNGTEYERWLSDTLELENIRLRRRNNGQSMRIIDTRSGQATQLFSMMEPDLVNALPSTHRPGMTSVVCTSVQRTVSLEERQMPGNTVLQEEASRRMSEGGVVPVPCSNGSDTDSSSSIIPVDVFPSIPDTLLHQLGLTHDKDRPPASETLTEQDIENRFLALSLAFKSDKITLNHRYELQHKQRDQAEKNMGAEVLRLKAAVHALNHLCIDSESVEILTKIQNQVDILQQATDRVSCSAEMFGAVQQEHRLNKAVEVMLTHVENLKRLYEKEHAELEETRRVLSENNIVMEEAIDTVDEPSRNASRYRALQSAAMNKMGSKRRASIAALPRPSTSLESNKSYGLSNSLMDGKTRAGGTVRRRTSMNTMLSGTISENSVTTLDSPDGLDRSNGLMDDIKEVAESRRESGASENEYNSSKYTEENNNSKLLMEGSLRRGSREQSDGMVNNIDTFEHEGEDDDEQTDKDLDDYFDDQLPSCGDALGLLAQHMATWALQFKEHVLEPYVPLDADVLSRYTRYFIAFLFVLAAIWIVGSSLLPSGATASGYRPISSCWSWGDLGYPFSLRHYEPPPT